jgi:hypothetical protein
VFYVFSLSSNTTTCLSSVLFFFSFSPYVLDGLFSSLVLLQKFFMFSIQSFNYNLSCIVFFNLILIILTSHFYPGFFVRVLTVFNFILQSKFMFFFQFNPHSFVLFFPFVVVFSSFFQFNYPI